MVYEWVGPFILDKLLDNVIDPSISMPPESSSVYLVTMESWKKEPAHDAIPIYVGSNTGKSKRFRTRTGDLIADIFGFYGEETSHSSGGKRINKYCKLYQIDPKKMYIGWIEYCDCQRCAEIRIYNIFHPKLNHSRPPKCDEHGLVSSY